jgi:hypothetical protein
MATAARSSQWPSAGRWCLAIAVSSALLVFAHYAASLKIELQPRFAIVNTRTIHNIQLVTLIDNHRDWAIGYLTLWLAVLVFCCWRRYPAWAAWLSFGAFGAPLILYFGACGYILGKFVDWL